MSAIGQVSAAAAGARGGGQAAAARPGETGREPALLPRELPSFASRACAVFLIALAATALAIAVFVRFPEAVQGTFVLAPERGVDPVKSPRRGIVESVAEDGASVKLGDILFTIRSDEMRALATERDTLLGDAKAARERLAELEAEAAARKLADGAAIEETKARIARLSGEREASRALDVAMTEKYAAGLVAAKARLAGCEKELEMETKRFRIAGSLRERTEAAFREGLTSELNALRERYLFQQADLDLERIRRRVEEAREELPVFQAARSMEVADRGVQATRREGELAEAQAIVERMKRESEARAALARERARQLSGTIEQGQVRLAALARELEGAEGDLLKIVAPYDGIVVRLGPKRPGVVIERGDHLCDLSRLDANLRAEIRLPEKEAARAVPSQPVRLLFSAYPYTRYGAKRATLCWVSPQGSEGFFRALAVMDDSEVMVGGAPRMFRAGMGGEARVIVGQRTLIEYVFEPLRQLRENVRPK